MPLKDILLPEYDHEMAVTRRVLERVPISDFAWKPHEKSMSLGELAMHLAHVPTWTRVVLDEPEFDLSAESESVCPPISATSQELLQRFDANVADGRRRLDTQSDPQLLSMWTFKRDGHVVFSLPRVAALRSFVMNHHVHHRGQLSVYLRLRNVAVPAMYGPSADEG